MEHSIKISKTLKTMVLENMVQNNIKEKEAYGIIFSTTKTENSIPTGHFLKSGEEIYIQA